MCVHSYVPAGNHAYKVFVQNTAPTSGDMSQIQRSSSASWTEYNSGVVSVPAVSSAVQCINPFMSLNVLIPVGGFQAFYITFTNNNGYYLHHRIHTGVDVNNSEIKVYAAGVRRQ
jgi:hypothetical protein